MEKKYTPTPLNKATNPKIIIKELRPVKPAVTGNAGGVVGLGSGDGLQVGPKVGRGEGVQLGPKVGCWAKTDVPPVINKTIKTKMAIKSSFFFIKSIRLVF